MLISSIGPYRGLRIAYVSDGGPCEHVKMRNFKQNHEELVFFVTDSPWQHVGILSQGPAPFCTVFRVIIVIISLY